ncbi:alpha-fetoprotein-like [Falco naumanni]|uniref:alpha-fetoprotein-like n=1 Tax=Falco naumanni TaxID=148594 RepID=UPI001ADDEDD7|nr:alpha-fetoprotein-like [Falco naumanni]
MAEAAITLRLPACRGLLLNQRHFSLCFSFIYEVSRRHPFLYAPTILSVAIRYDEMMENCCRSAEDPTHNLEECFRRQVFHHRRKALSSLPLSWSATPFYQAPKVVKPVKEDSLRQEHTCGILKKFGERTLKALKLAQISQKFPKADFVTVNKLVTDIANMHKDCCRGDMLDCMRDREEILHYVCANQDILSSKIKKCCEKPLLQRSECIVNAENDDKPEDLSPHIREFIEDKGICERFAQEKDTHLARFLYEYSRRHPEFSAQMLLRIGKGYEDLLQECCKAGAPDNCCSRGVGAIRLRPACCWIQAHDYFFQEEELKKHIYETESVMKTSCDIYKEKGDYYFQNELLMSFTKKMPQLTSAELIKFTKQMTTVGSKCCQLSQDKLLPCAEENVSIFLFYLGPIFSLNSATSSAASKVEELGVKVSEKNFPLLFVKLDLVLGEICRRHLTDPINPGVCHCCSSSYALRRPCMGKLEIDENYVPLSLTPDLFTFHEDLCTTEEEKLQHKKQELEESNFQRWSQSPQKTSLATNLCHGDPTLLRTSWSATEHIHHLQHVFMDIDGGATPKPSTDIVFHTGSRAHLCSLLKICVWVADKSEKAVRRKWAVTKKALCRTSVGETLPERCAYPPASQGLLCFSCRMLINLIKYKPQITQEQLSSVTAAFTAMREQCCKEASHEACFVREVSFLFSLIHSKSKQKHGVYIKV